MRAASSAVLAALGLSVVGVLVFGVIGTTSAPAAPPAVEEGTELVVGVHLAAPGLRAGAVRRGELVAGTGLEIDVVRALARAMGARSLRLVAVADPAALTRAGAKTWDVAIGGIAADAPGGASRSSSYLRADPVVLMRPGLARPRGLADLRARVLCAVAGSDGARAARSIRSVFEPLTVRGEPELVRLVASGRCDAAVGDAPLLGSTLQRLGGRRGHVGGRMDTGSGWVLAVPRGSSVAPAVDRALARLRADGTLGRIAERWLGFDPSGLRVLR